VFVRSPYSVVQVLIYSLSFEARVCYRSREFCDFGSEWNKNAYACWLGLDLDKINNNKKKDKD